MSAAVEPQILAPEPMPHLNVYPGGKRRITSRGMNGMELFWDLAAQTLANLRRNKLRSFLTLFGIAWGIASLVMMSALSDGFRDGQRKNMAQIGDSLVFVWGGTTEIASNVPRSESWRQRPRRARCPCAAPQTPDASSRLA